MKFLWLEMHLKYAVFFFAQRMREEGKFPLPPTPHLSPIPFPCAVPDFKGATILVTFRDICSKSYRNKG